MVSTVTEDESREEKVIGIVFLLVLLDRPWELTCRGGACFLEVMMSVACGCWFSFLHSQTLPPQTCGSSYENFRNQS